MSLPTPRLSEIRVSDAMHTGILTTDASTPLRTVARLMATQRVHAVAVTDPENARRPFGIVSALDVAAAAAVQVEETAGQAAATEVLTIAADEPLVEAARLMASHGLTHLVVVDPATGHPSGVISTLDIAQAYAG
jgi:CBS domain-containing protein